MQNNDVFQFYPTPPGLMIHAWHKFKNRNFVRVLEPSAGKGDLLEHLKEERYYHNIKVDVIELNLSHHPILREKKYRVVDTDFLKFQSRVSYSHIIMNPPFNQGVDHVLHAWDLLRDGEIVAIINAETVRNPCTKKRQFLVDLIQKHGDVEFIEDAFMDPDTQRKTEVEIALVHLIREYRFEIDLTRFGLTEEHRDEHEITPRQDLALPQSTIRNTVIAFNAAVRAMEESVKASAEAGYYASLIRAKRPVEPSDDDDEDIRQTNIAHIPFADVRDTISEEYDRLKESAWRHVLDSYDFTSRFSRKVRQDIQHQLDDLIQMEFTEENVYALLEGLLASKTELDMQVLEEIFDEITKYHSENREHYMGWKSNDKHRLGFRIRSTRFILPSMANWDHSGLSYDADNLFQDIDRAFAMLDGKAEPDFGLLDLSRSYDRKLPQGERLESDYFDVRFYSGIGTLHFFPKRKDLIDRLNRIVGSRRQWLPDQPADATEAFWEQYEKADLVQKEIDKEMQGVKWRWFNDEDLMTRKHREVCEKMGMDPSKFLAIPADKTPESTQLGLDLEPATCAA